MSDYDRRNINESWEHSFPICTVKIRGNVEIDKGDFVFLDKTDALRERGASTANWYGYPFDKVSGSILTLTSNRKLAASNFLGVAAWHSDSGVTEELGVYIDGFFRYPLRNSRSTKVLYYIIPAGSGVTLYNQKVAITSSTSDWIGVAGDGGNFRSSVLMRMWSRIFGNVIDVP